MKHLLFYFCLFPGCYSANAQTYIAGEEVEASSIKPWVAASVKAYEGAYQFGYSEGEYELLLVVNNGVATAQFRSGAWNEKATSFRFSYTSLHEVRIEGRRLYSKELVGEFVVVQEADEKLYGLKKIDSKEKGKELAEVGRKKESLEEFYPRKFPQVSYRLLQPDKVHALSKTQLSLMRNEIFARHGYMFQKGSESAAYFKKQEWYTPYRTDTSTFLNAIEKENIALIKAIEGQE